MHERDLELFLHLSRSLNFSRTSEACHITASSLSRVIKRLEERVGHQLFERDNRRVRITPAGQQFREYAEQSLNHWDALQDQLAQDKGMLAGEISIFCSVTASYSFLYDLLSEFRREYAQVEIKLHTGDTATTIERIRQEQEDVGIAAIPPQVPANLAVQEITQTPLVFIKPKNDLHLRHAFSDSGDILWDRMPMILSETGLARQEVDQWFRARQVAPVIYAQVAGNEAIVSMVSLGFGVGLVPKLVAENSPLAEKIEFVAARPALTPFSVGLCTLKRKLSSPTIRAFWELAARSLRDKEDLAPGDKTGDMTRPPGQGARKRA